jgi:cobalt-zinc-cadmium efflux system outer membrane protein
MTTPATTMPRRSNGVRVTAGLALGAALLAAAPLPSRAQSGVALPAGVAPSAPATDVAVLGFDEALARALERNPALVAARGGREVAAAQLRRARAWQNPTLDIEAEKVLGPGQDSDFDSAETTVSLIQPLPIGGGRAAAIRGARAGEAGAEAGAELAMRELRRDVAIAYADAIAAERLAGIARERARLGAETRDAVARRLAAGLESELQRARIEVDTSGLQAAARRAAAEAMARRRALAALWREDAVAARLDDAWFDAAGRATAPALGLVSDVATHPRLRGAEQAVLRAGAALEAARAQRFTGLEARIGSRSFGSAVGIGDQAFVLGLALPLPVWNRNGAGIAEARVALASAEAAAERVRRELEGARVAAAAELEAADIELRALSASGLPAAQSAAALARRGYEAGRLSLLERIDAERSLSDLRERLELARRAMHRARAELESLR